MNKFKASLFTLLILSLTFSITSCGGNDDEPGLTPEQERVLQLAGANGTVWNATSITFEGGPANGFDNFSLSLFGDDPNGTLTYNSNDGEPLFSSSGTWTLGNSINQLIFDGDESNAFAISEFNADSNPSTMTLTVNFTANGGVANGISGTDGLYVLELEAQ